MASIVDFPALVFEGHSTDYQTKIKLRELVEDGVGILKVGPALTFAMREAIFALENIEKELLADTGIKLSNFSKVLDEEMLKETKYWSKHYKGTQAEVKLKRKYSFSDRCRYYMPTEPVENAKNTLISNLKTHGTKVREGLLENEPEALIMDRIINTIDEYLYATHQKELI